MSDHRRCESCGGAMPNRTHRRRNQKGNLVCDSCADNLKPTWAAHANLDYVQQAEMQRREAEAIVSVLRVGRLTREAHDSGDGALINHCPFCGSGSVTGRSDGSAECDFCNNVFTVQVQPSHPNMPQTVDGQPVTPPGMPGGQTTEVSGTDDPSVHESEDGVAANPLSDDDPTKPKKPNPFDKNPQGAPQAGDKPNPFAKKDPAAAPGGDKKKSAPPWLKNKKSSAEMVPCPECAVRTYGDDDEPNPPTKGPGCFFCKGRGEIPSDRVYPSIWGPHTMQDVLDNRKAFRTATGAVLSPEDYMAHLALSFADDREAVLDTVRVANVERKVAERVPCPDCGNRETVMVGGRRMVKPKVEGAPPYVCGTCNGVGSLGVVGKQAAHPDYPHGVPYECLKCGNYRTKDHCDTCSDRAQNGHQRGPTFVDYLMHGLLPSGASASQHTALGEVTCPLCHGLGQMPPDGDDCSLCGGEGMVMWSDVEAYRQQLEEHAEDSDEAYAALNDLNSRYPKQAAGTPLIMQAPCRNCGARFPLKDKKCPECGHVRPLDQQQGTFRSDKQGARRLLKVCSCPGCPKCSQPGSRCMRRFDAGSSDNDKCPACRKAA